MIRHPQRDARPRLHLDHGPGDGIGAAALLDSRQGGCYRDTTMADPRYTTRDLNLLTRSVGSLNVKVRLLEKLLHLFTDVSEVRRNIAAVLEAVLEAIPCEAGSILLADVEKEDYFFAAARGPVAEKVLQLRLEPGQGIIGAAVADRRTLAVSDVSRDPLHATDLSKSLGHQARSILACPIFHQGEVLGGIELINKTRAGDVWMKHEIELLERAARTAGALLALGQSRQAPPGEHEPP